MFPICSKHHVLHWNRLPEPIDVFRDKVSGSVTGILGITDVLRQSVLKFTLIFNLNKPINSSCCKSIMKSVSLSMDHEVGLLSMYPEVCLSIKVS